MIITDGQEGTLKHIVVPNTEHDKWPAFWLEVRNTLTVEGHTGSHYPPNTCLFYNYSWVAVEEENAFVAHRAYL